MLARANIDIGVVLQKIARQKGVPLVWVVLQILQKTLERLVCRLFVRSVNYVYDSQILPIVESDDVSFVQYCLDYRDTFRADSINNSLVVLDHFREPC